MSDADLAKNLEYLPYSRPNLDEADIEAVASVLRGTMISQGQILVEFESAFAAATESRHAVAFSTGSAALHGMCFAAGISTGDEVVLPALTFASTANAVLHLGGTPVFADIDPETFCIDPASIERLITDQTKAILAVDFAGRPCDYDAIKPLAEKHGLTLLADAAHAAGGSFHGGAVGSLADMTAFSFNPVKNLTTGEGGMVTCSDESSRDVLARFRVHGMTRAADQLLNAAPAGWYYEQQHAGFNYKLSELHAALGLSQLAKLLAFNSRRRKLADRYRELLCDLPLRLPPTFSNGDHAWHIFVVRLLDSARMSRDELFERLRELNIGVQLHYIPVPLHPYYQDLGFSVDNLKHTLQYFQTAVSLPLHPGLSDEEQDYVVASLTNLLG